MELRRGNAWALAAVLGTALAGTAVVQGCGGDDAVTPGNTNDAGTTSTTVDSGGGGTTLSCAAPATQCGDACVDTKNDPKNCGTCGTACAAGLACSEGVCGLACAGGATKCADACVDTDVDTANCGACGKACKTGEVCSNGTCGLTCTSPLAKCDAPDGGAAQAFCAKVKTDSDNCGACGFTCAANERCVNGACNVGCNTGADCKSTNARCVANACVVPRDCSDIKESNPAAPSGAYTIDPDGAGAIAPFSAYCDMQTDGGGWTIIASMTGADGEEGLTSDTEATAGNPLTFQRFNLDRAKKKALSNLATESLFLRNNGQWLVADKPMFASGGGKDLTVADSNDEIAVNLRYQAAGVGAATPGFMGWSNHLIAAGGDFGISKSPDFTTCNGAYTTTNGFDHHSAAAATTYYQLNCSCNGQYLYSYSAQAADGDASYKAGVSLGAPTTMWTATAACSNTDGSGLVFYAAMRRPIALGASCKAVKTATPAAADGWYTIDPDGAGAKPAIGVYCDMTTDGGGYTMLPIRNGVSSFKFDDPNTCQDLGLQIIVPRTKAHLTKMASFAPGYFATIPGIYRNVDPADGNANYSTSGAAPCAMQSGDQTKCSTDWRGVDAANTPWFVRGVNHSEPNGDYTKGCWLSWNGAVDANGALNWNDGNCGIQTGTSYVCSDNAK